MTFIHLVDTDGKHHLVNPGCIAAVHEADAGCVLLLRGRSGVPILLSETVEVMGDALESYKEKERMAVAAME